MGRCANGGRQEKELKAGSLILVAFLFFYPLLKIYICTLYQMRQSQTTFYLHISTLSHLHIFCGGGEIGRRTTLRW